MAITKADLKARTTNAFEEEEELEEMGKKPKKVEEKKADKKTENKNTDKPSYSAEAVSSKSASQKKAEEEKQKSAKYGKAQQFANVSSNKEKKTKPATDYSYLMTPQERGSAMRSDTIAKAAGVKKETIDDIRKKANEVYGKDVFTESVESGVANAIADTVGGIQYISKIIPQGKLFNKVVGEENNPLNKINDSLQDWKMREAEEALAAADRTGKGNVAKFGSQAITAVTQMVPDIVLAVATGGTSKAASGASKGLKVFTSAKNFIPAVKQAAKQTAKNPNFWLNFEQMLYPEYEAAIANGATEEEANAVALLSAFGQAKVESESGFQALGKGNSATIRNVIFNYVKSAIEEGNEEVVQGIISGVTQKLVFDHDKQLVSTNAGEDAVLNIADAFSEWLLGTFVGSVASAPGSLLNAGAIANAQRTSPAPDATVHPETPTNGIPEGLIVDPVVPPVSPPLVTDDVNNLLRRLADEWNITIPESQTPHTGGGEIPADILSLLGKTADKWGVELPPAQPMTKATPEAQVFPTADDLRAQLIPPAVGEESGAQTAPVKATPEQNPLVSQLIPQESRAQNPFQSDSAGAQEVPANAQSRTRTPQQTRIDVELQNMDALKDTPSDNFVIERETKKNKKKKDEKPTITPAQAERYRKRVDALEAYKAGGWTSLNMAQKEVITTLRELDVDISPNNIDNVIARNKEWLRESDVKESTEASPTQTTIPQYATIAPYRKTDITPENREEITQKVDKVFNDVATTTAKEIGISIKNVVHNVGGYMQESGEHRGEQTRELSYTFELGDATPEQSALFASLMAENGFEEQEASISKRYVSSFEEGNAYEFNVRYIDSDGIAIGEMLESIGITDYTIVEGENTIQLLSFDDEQSAAIEKQIQQIIERLGGNYYGTEYQPIASDYLDAETREGIYRAWLEKSGENGDLRSDITQSLQKVQRFLAKEKGTGEIKEEPSEAQSSEAKTEKKELAFPRLAEMRKEIFGGKKYTLEELNALPEIQEAKKRAHLDSKETSTTKFFDVKTGDWTAERKIKHADIVSELMNLGSAEIDEEGEVKYVGPVEQGRHADIVIGPPAAGKSTVFADPLSQLHKARIIDSDMVKERLPEFNSGYGANFVHEESASVADTDLKNEAVGKGENVIFPLVGGKTAKIRKLMNFLRNEGYSINLYYNEVPSDVAMNRAFARFVEKGRFLPLDYVAGIYSDPENNPTVTYYTLLKEGVADYYEHKSNDVPYGTEPPFVEDPTGRDLYRPGNQGEVRHEQPVRQGRSSDGGNLPTGNRTSEKSVKTEEKTPNVPGEKNLPETGIGARKSGENIVAQKASKYGTFDVPKDVYTDFDNYLYRNEVDPAETDTLKNQKINYGDRDVPLSEAVVEMVMDEVKFSEQKGKYYADGTEIPKAAYNFGKFLEDNGVQYWNNKAEQFPKQWDSKKRVSRFLRNIAASKYGTNENIALLEDALKNGVFLYTQKHNKDDIENAKSYITAHGFADSYAEWNRFADGNERVTPKEISRKMALGVMLLDVANEIGDMDTAIDIARGLGAWGSGMGQGIQFMSIIRKLGKNGDAPFKLTKSEAEYYAEKVLATLNRRYEDKLKGNAIVLPDELRNEWINAIGTENEMEITEKVFGHIANQIPSSFFDRFNSWRYFCMLCAPSTHGKNIASNVAMSGATFLKNVYLSRLEKTYQKKHPEYIRTASITTNKGDRDYAKTFYNEANLQYGQRGSRYSYESKGVESRRKNTFSGADYKIAKGLRQKIGKPIDAMVNSVTGLLEAEDTMTKKGLYARKVAQIMKANGWTKDYFESDNPKAIQAFELAKEKGIKEAYKATFNNPNKYQDLLTSWHNMPNNTVGDRVVKAAVGALIEITFPFKKVTANIPARAIEYSPIGIVQGVLELKLDKNKKDFDPALALEHIAAGGAGSTIAMAGAILGLLGVAQLGSDDEDENELKETAGWQSYSLKLGDIYVALDDIAPVTTMLMGGVKLAQEFKEFINTVKSSADKGEVASAALGSLLELTTFGIDGILQLDFFTSIKDLMTSYGGETGNKEVFGEKLEGVAESIVGQVEPNILRKIMRTIEDEYANAYYYDKNDKTPQWIQNIKSGVKLLIPDSKIEQLVYNTTGQKVDVPGYSDLAVRYDKWGRSLNPENFWMKAANNLGSPFQLSKDRTTPVDKELQRVYSETKNSSVVPQNAQKYYTENGKKVNMTAKEYSAYQKALGTTRYDMLEKLFRSSYYKNLSEKDKVKAIEGTYTLAADVAKDDVFGEPYDSYEKKHVSRTSGYDHATESGLSASAYIANKAVYNNLSHTKEYKKDERFYDYLIADKTTSDKDDVLLLESILGANFDKHRNATNDYGEMLDIYDAYRAGDTKAERIEELSDKFDDNDLKAYALYSVSYGTKKYKDGEFDGFGSKQIKKAQTLSKKGWNGEKIAKGANAVAGLDDYLGDSRKTKKNYIAVLKNVGFTDKEAEEFYKVYGW